MKKDIQIPEVKDVYVAVVREFNETHRTNDWNAYIINDKEVDLDMVLIVTKGYDQDRETSLMRHKLDKLPAKSYAKVEFLQDEVLALNNEFKVTFFEGTSMFDKTYLFRKNTINENALQTIPLMKLKGVLVR
ncbi:hypothetical protein [Winogradskyella sp. 3972H.M.0a.05]|uniref:hypothetical protein n=1 Tax=Winogradskyella sp. 3972H.M.0a.05 TaxID=2950277 RepID=UPI0033910D35